MQNITHETRMDKGAGTLSVAIGGDILSTNADSVRTRLNETLDRPEAAAGAFSVLELDLRRARMIDSVGLNLLVWLIKRTGERGGRLRLLVADNNIERTLQFTRLSQHAEIVRV